MAGLQDFLQSASNEAAGTVSMPVDAIAWLLQKAGLPVSKPVGGSDWMAERGLTKPVQQNAASLAGQTAGLLSPMVAAAKAPQIARGLLQAGENLAAPTARGMVAGQRGAIDVGKYQIDHKPMTKEGGAATLDDLTAAFGDDIYSSRALQFFGSGDARERSILKTMASLRGKPDAKVTIYRGVPDEAAGINAGDWVTLDKRVASDYASQHPGGKVVALEVPASHVTSWADSLLEFGYHPPKANQ